MQSDFLQPGEKATLELRRDPRSALDAWLGIALLWALVAAGAFVVAGFVTATAVPYAIAIVVVATLIAAGSAIAVAFRVHTTRMVVTRDRVYHAYGKLRFYLSQTTYDRVTDLHVHQSFFGRHFDFGTVTVQTSGLGVRLIGVKDPLQVKQAIEQAREDMIRHLVQRHALPASSKGAAKTQAAPQPTTATPRSGPATWTGGPVFASVVARYLGPALFLVFFLLFSGVTAQVAQTPLAVLLPVGVAVVSGLVAVNAVMQFRRTSYEIHPWGVAVASGWLSRRRVEARYEKVTDVTVLQPILGRLFGFGTLQINTAGSNETAIQFHGVRRPDDVKAIVDQARAQRGSA